MSKYDLHKKETATQYPEKELDDVSEIIIDRQKTSRQSLSDERYLFFWDTIDKIGVVNRDFYCSDSRPNEFFEYCPELSSCYLHNIQFQNSAEDILRIHSDLTYFITDLINTHSFTGCIVNDTNSSKIFKEIVQLINNSITVFIGDFNKPDNDMKKFYDENSSILVFNDGFNIGQSVLRVLRFIGVEEIKRKNNLSLLSLVSRKNVRKTTVHLESEYISEILKTVNQRHYIYYKSDLPFYLLNIGDIELDRRFRDSLRNISNI